MMRKATVFMKSIFAGILEEREEGGYRFTYESNYRDLPISLTMPIKQQVYDFDEFPRFFEGLLPEGQMLEGFLRQYKLDRNDYFAQLLVVGRDVVGAVSIEEIK